MEKKILPTVQNEAVAGSRPVRSSPPRPRLFLWFSVLSLISFTVVGYLVVSAIRPAITNFVIARQEADTVVFANRLANNLLSASDFNEPRQSEADERFSIFLQGLQIPARIAVEVVDSDGKVVAADLPDRIGKKINDDPNFKRVKNDLLSKAVFRPLNSSEKEAIGTSEVFELYIPLTFGVSPEVAGVVHSLSRTGFLQGTIRNIENDIAIRIGGGFLLLYFTVSTIVLGASRTIRRQAGALADYATTLESKVRARTRELQAVFNSVAEGILVINQDFRIVLMNRSAEEILGVRGPEASGQKWTDLVSMYRGQNELPYEEWATSYVLKTGKVKIFNVADNISFKRKDGRMVPVVIIASPLVENKNIEGAVLMFRDVREERKFEEARANFINIASHQLRTPITSIRWFVELLMEKEEVFTIEDREFISSIHAMVLRLSTLVNLFLQIGRLESGRVKVDPVPTDFKLFTEEVIMSLQQKYRRDHQTRKFEIITDPKNLPKIPMDPDVVLQVVQNLLDNVFLYSSPESPITVRITADNAKNEYIWSVEDQGIGIPPSQQNRIFEKFFRADNALKLIPNGSGLGLALAKEVVDDWGGKIWFESEEGKGTTFFFTMPKEGMKPREGEVKLSV